MGWVVSLLNRERRTQATSSLLITLFSVSWLSPEENPVTTPSLTCTPYLLHPPNFPPQHWLVLPTGIPWHLPRPLPETSLCFTLPKYSPQSLQPDSVVQWEALGALTLTLTLRGKVLGVSPTQHSSSLYICIPGRKCKGGPTKITNKANKPLHKISSSFLGWQIYVPYNPKKYVFVYVCVCMSMRTELCCFYDERQKK